MKRIALALISILGIYCSASAHEAGIVLGSASGFSGVLDLNSSNRAVDLGLAWNSDSSLYLYGDYLFTHARSFSLKGASSPMTLYYGLGARMIKIKGGKHDGDTQFGPRTPIGLHYALSNPDISLFGELAAVLNLTPESSVDLTAGIGFRVRF